MGVEAPSDFSELPPDLTEKPEPVQAMDTVVGAGVRDSEGRRRRPPGSLPSHHGAVSHARKGDNEGVGASTFGLLVDEPRARLHNLGDGRHLRVVERKKETRSVSQCFGKGVVAPLQLLKNFIGRHEVACSDRGIEPMPQRDEDVWRVVSADPNPDTRVDHVGRRHALLWSSYALDGTRDVVEMLQADAKIVADVRRGDPLSIQGFQDEAGVFAPVIPYHDTKEWCEPTALSCLGLESSILGEILLALAFVEVVGCPAQNQKAPQDDLAADGELIGQLLERPVGPVTRTANGGHERVAE
jgi:hypothetical protein